MKLDRPIDIENLINSNGNINIPMKFMLHQKVYHPRITEQRKLLDIREYYIVKISITIDKNFTSIYYYTSPNKEKVRGQLFREGNQLFESYEKGTRTCKTTRMRCRGYIKEIQEVFEKQNWINL